MEPLTTFTGRMVPLPRSGVDTDQIIPSDYCRRLTRTGFEEGLFAGWRGQPGFALDDPRRAGATVLVARADFGTGSSREPAVWALQGWGIRAVVAESFGDIFRTNAYKNGMLAVELPRGAVDAIRDEATADPAAELTVDLLECAITGTAGRWTFDVPARARWLLLNGMDEIATTLDRSDRIVAHERARPPWLPARPVAAAGAGR